MWDFSTDADFQAKLDWIDGFVRDEIEPLDLVFPGEEHELPSPTLRELIEPLRERVKAEHLWACHLPSDLGGQGYGQVKLALMNEVLGRSAWAPVIFGTQAPDAGNAEIIAKYGTAEQKERYLYPLLEGRISSCYSMTEPHAGSDPTMFTTSAVRDRDEWVITGEKYFSSNARNAAFFLVMAVSKTYVDPRNSMSMFLVPADTPGIEFRRDVGTMAEPMNGGSHAWIRYDGVRIPAESLLGNEGQAFVIAQTRLGGGRIHHAMRAIAVCKQAFGLMCERAISRETQGSLLADKQIVQAQVADSWIEIEQFRLLVLYTAWLIDCCVAAGDLTAAGVRKEIAACKVETARVLHAVVFRAMHLHGAVGVSNEMPFARMWMRVPELGILDGPTEVHQTTIARQVLRDHGASDGLFPSAWLPPRIDAARARFADALEHHVANS